MNRAMGFGVAAGTMMGTMVATTSVASAHERTISDSYGAVTVSSDHRTIKVTDYTCSDGYETATDYKYQSGGTTYLAGTGAGAHTCGRTIARTPPGPVVYFRKCVRDGGYVDPADCGDWVAP